MWGGSTVFCTKRGGPAHDQPGPCWTLRPLASSEKSTTPAYPNWRFQVLKGSSLRGRSELPVRSPSGPF
ncbi:hypothetical protein MGG_16430 [Pyricularia oryzae 70-15]|uniref:Uncharacterized protein n=3 Tax=Pyricularia oryzae TaxID=318829 RepID=G4MNL5_PYRO7|nr:uncharacterized protein MGG_16430 [Pyricularia oryzae 70-15]EHA57921.1 hypothetical protein MGG_16430 [Pyricularia oryzae 70-15]ELQ36947.1 hypothetical protein OOU_Y34scaffold00624g43 [Pyricularia oryzae Y34]KAI7924407.1 hypothetical protein M9X92_003852 [Pyricularia oryzae]KAI7931348.1 hypothetical protein M0657_001302 [Pyricularia oryzae]